MKVKLPLLGRGRRREDPLRRTLQFAKYTAALSAPPGSCNWAEAVAAWKALGNLTIGDCTAVAVAHALQAMLANAFGQQWAPPYQRVLGFYSATSGYKPGHPATDVGADMLTVMNRWHKAGLAGYKCQAYAAVDPQNTLQLQQATWLMGATPIGLLLPLAVQNLLAPNSVWDVPSGPLTGDWAADSWGGHCVPLLAYDAAADTYLALSWQWLYTLTGNFVRAYCDEAYAPFCPTTWCRLNYAPNGFDTTSLLADVAAIPQLSTAAA
jgi:hypothetical protein